MMTLKEKFNKNMVPALKSELKIKNALAVPRLEKIVINMGIGKLVTSNLANKDKIREQCEKIISMVSGQAPSRRQARISISGFKVREGEVVGLAVTLRGQKMYDFLERFIGIALPRSRDFRGISMKSIDKSGILSIGVREHIIFLEVASEETKQLYGFEITFVPTTRNRDKAIALYRALGVPFAK